MSQRADATARSKPAAIDGLLLLNKPSGMTSNRALQTVKRLLKARKAGHTGSLDPAATGMLPLCFGEATKICAYLLAADKTYRVTAKLGEATDTGDADGKVTETAPLPQIDQKGWASILAGFLGDSTQIPPMYSALKQDGKRLYELARKGEVVDREPRAIRIDSISLVEHRGSRLVFSVHCSKGTYIRTLVEDIARVGGTVAHTARLHRETVGHFRAADMLEMGEVEAAALEDPEGLRKRLLPADAALTDWRTCRIEDTDTAGFNGGQPAPCQASGTGLVKVYGAQNRFLGIGELTEEGHVLPRRIFRVVP